MSYSLKSVDKTKDQIVDRLQKLAAEAQEICSSLTSDTKDTTARLARRARRKAEALQTQATEKARKVDRVIRRNPYRTVGIAFALGLVATAFIRWPRRGEEAPVS